MDRSTQYRFPSGHGIPCQFHPIAETPRSTRPAASSFPPKGARRKTPSYAEIDVVEADLSNDPRHDDHDEE
jgi:hypothetical protein